MADPYRIWTSCQLTFDRSLYKRRQASLAYQRSTHCRSCRLAVRHDTARVKRVDGDGGIKAAIWGGALAARHACVGGFKPERYHSVKIFAAALPHFRLCLSARSLFSDGACLLSHLIIGGNLFYYFNLKWLPI
jgi:hypothetical protein